MLTFQRPMAENRLRERKRHLWETVFRHDSSAGESPAIPHRPMHTFRELSRLVECLFQMRAPESLRSTWGRTQPLFKRGRNISWGIVSAVSGSLFISLVLGNPLFWDELGTLVTILFAAVVFEFLSVYLWNLWLAPYLVIEEHITKMILIPANPSQVPAADGLRAERHETSPSAWKTVPAFKIWAAPDLSVGVAPGAAESRPTDRTRAMLVRLVGAVRSGKLRLLAEALPR